MAFILVTTRGGRSRYGVLQKEGRDGRRHHKATPVILRWSVVFRDKRESIQHRFSAEGSGPSLLLDLSGARRAKPGRFGSLAFAMKNRHFGGERSWILAGKARKCGNNSGCLRVSRILVNKASGETVSSKHKETKHEKNCQIVP